MFVHKTERRVKSLLTTTIILF